MVFVGPVLRNYLDLCASVPSVFGVIVIRHNLYFLDGVFVRRDDGCSAPGNTCSSDTVNLVIIFAGSGAVGRDLAAILNLEDSFRTTGTTDRRSGQVLGSTSGRLCS